MSHFIFLYWHFPPIFVLLKNLSGNTVRPQASDFQKLAKLTVLCHFCPLKMKIYLATLAMWNETISVIFKHCALEKCKKRPRKVRRDDVYITKSCSFFLEFEQ